MKKTNRGVFLVWWVLLLAFVVKAEQGPQPFLLHWTEKDGLCDDLVYRVLKDQQGWLWVGTANGLCRFDGKEFTSFRNNLEDALTVGAHEIRELYEAHDGGIWVGMDGAGLSVYNAQTNRFHNWRQNLEKPALGLTEDRVYSFLENDQKEMLIGYRAIGSGRGGVSILSADKTQVNIVEHALQDVPDYADFPMKVTSIWQDPNVPETYWLGGRSFFRWDRNQQKHQEFPHPGFLPNYDSVSGIIELSDSTLLVGFVYDGLWVFNRKRQVWQEQLHQIPVLSFLQDQEGFIWLADERGVARINLTTKTTHYELELNGIQSPFKRGTSIYHLYKPDDELWISTNQGLYCWSPLFRQFPLKQFDLGDNQHAYYPDFAGAISNNEWLFVDKKRGLLLTDSTLEVEALYLLPAAMEVRKAIRIEGEADFDFVIAGNRGLFSWSLDDRTIRPYRPRSTTINTDAIQVWSFHFDRNRQQLWMGTRTSGLLRIDLESDSLVQYLHKEGEPASLCHDKFLFEIEKGPKGLLWIGTDKGVSIIDPESNRFLLEPDLSIVQNYVIHSLEPDALGNMWIGSRNQGLFRYDSHAQEWHNYTMAEGLPYNGVNKMIAKDSFLWVGTREGLGRLDLRNQKIDNFNQKKGLHSNSLYATYMNELPDGDLMMTYQYTPYFTKFDPRQLQTQFASPKLLIQSLRILTNSASTARSVSDGDFLALEPSENYFAIDFKAIHFFQPRGIQYRYRLEGYDEDWIDAQGNNSAVYTNLPGGDYTFEVKAANEDGQWSSTQSLKIHLAKPWYQTLWFYALLLLSISGLLYLFYDYRTRQIRKEENFKRQLAETEMKALRSQINPHFIFNCLNSIKRYIIENRIEEGSEFVGRFSQLIRMILNHSKERLIALSNEIEALRLYTWLEQERLQHRFTVDFELDLQHPQDQLLVPPLLFQPYIENAIWHGLMNLPEQGNLKIRIEEHPENLQIQILDNGIGRKAAMEIKNKSIFSRPSLGLELAAKRLAQINKLYELEATVEIRDQFIGQSPPGTMVHIVFPKLKKHSYVADDYRG